MHVALFVTKIGVVAITSLKTSVPLDCEHNSSSYLTKTQPVFNIKTNLLIFFRGTYTVDRVTCEEHV
jgi:hypothetical protein